MSSCTLALTQEQEAVLRECMRKCICVQESAGSIVDEFVRLAEEITKAFVERGWESVKVVQEVLRCFHSEYNLLTAEEVETVKMRVGIQVQV